MLIVIKVFLTFSYIVRLSLIFFFFYGLRIKLDFISYIHSTMSKIPMYREKNNRGQSRATQKAPENQVMLLIG